MYQSDHLPEELNRVLSENAEKIKTPIILFAGKQLQNNYKFFCDEFKVNDKVFYPVKANNTSAVIDILKGLDSCFEIASLGELELLKLNGVTADRIIFSNPVKIRSHISAAYNYGVKTFAFDSESELHKINELAPGSSVYLRLSVDNEGAEWKLNDKFGVAYDEAISLLKKAITLGLTPSGISFHVGWNNTNIKTWKNEVNKAVILVEQCFENDIEIKFLNIGGGFPAHNNDPYVNLKKISLHISPLLVDLKERFGVEVYSEPGSFMVANTAVLVTEIIAVIDRGENTWVYINTGINQGFYWVFEDIKYNILYPYDSDSGLKAYVVTGPTCDSHDVFTYNGIFPDRIKEGDRLLIYPAGAYITSAREYNGFSYPETLVL
jgi:ornithine decarboxylase